MQNGTEVAGLAELVDEIIELDQQIAAASETLTALKKRRRDVEMEAVEEFIESNTSRITRQDRTVYLSQTWRASIPAEVDRDAAYAALAEGGLGHVVNMQYNASRLSADIRERIEDKQEDLVGLDGDEIIAALFGSKCSFIRLYNQVQIKTVKGS